MPDTPSRCMSNISLPMAEIETFHYFVYSNAYCNNKLSVRMLKNNLKQSLKLENGNFKIKCLN